MAAWTHAASGRPPFALAAPEGLRRPGREAHRKIAGQATVGPAPIAHPGRRIGRPPMRRPFEMARCAGRRDRPARRRVDRPRPRTTGCRLRSRSRPPRPTRRSPGAATGRAGRAPPVAPPPPCRMVVFRPRPADRAWTAMRPGRIRPARIDPGHAVFDIVAGRADGPGRRPAHREGEGRQGFGHGADIAVPARRTGRGQARAAPHSAPCISRRRLAVRSNSKLPAPST